MVQRHTNRACHTVLNCHSFRILLQDRQRSAVAVASWTVLYFGGRVWVAGCCSASDLVELTGLPVGNLEGSHCRTEDSSSGH